jgi:multisubunit Na+/H+ antiporter MnhG subunit
MVEKKRDSEEGLGIAGFTLGILSIVFAGWAGVIIAIIGFFLCFYQQRKAPTKIGRWGLILNIIGFALGIIVIIIVLKYLMPFIQQMQNTPLV